MLSVVVDFGTHFLLFETPVLCRFGSVEKRRLTVAPLVLLVLSRFGDYIWGRLYLLLGIVLILLVFVLFPMSKVDFLLLLLLGRLRWFSWLLFLRFS